MHKARHGRPAGPRCQLATSRPCRSFLGHSSIQTTGDIYADWDIDALTSTMAEVLEEDA
jgi:hypothetical protein